MIKNSYKYFSNRECQYYYVCHNGADKNCLFCYCPLYCIDCPGTPEYTAAGIKDCSNCMFPHMEENYHVIIELLTKINQKK